MHIPCRCWSRQLNFGWRRKVFFDWQSCFLKVICGYVVLVLFFFKWKTDAIKLQVIHKFFFFSRSRKEYKPRPNVMEIKWHPIVMWGQSLYFKSDFNALTLGWWFGLPCENSGKRVVEMFSLRPSTDILVQSRFYAALERWRANFG